MEKKWQLQVHILSTGLCFIGHLNLIIVSLEIMRFCFMGSALSFVLITVESFV